MVNSYVQKQEPPFSLLYFDILQNADAVPSILPVELLVT